MTGEEMRVARKGMGYTQEGLAKLLGVARKTVNEMENGATIDTRTEMAVRAEARRIKVIEHTFWVAATNRNTYSVAQRLVREVEHPTAMSHTHSDLMLYGEFKRRDHAYRWCAALHRSDNARNTRKLLHSRAAEAAKA